MSDGEPGTLLTAPTEELPGVGPVYLKKLHRLGLESFLDLFCFLPFRYEDRTVVSKLSDITPGGPYLVEAKIVSNQGFTNARTPVLKILVQDPDGTYATLVFFHASRRMAGALAAGVRLEIFGSMQLDYNGQKSFLQPELKFLNKLTSAKPQDRLTPVYHTTDKLPQNLLRKFIKTALSMLENKPVPELLPPGLNSFGLTLTEAFLHLHHPPKDSGINALTLEQSRHFKRICFEELAAYQISLMRLKDRNKKPAALSVPYDEALQQSFLSSLPFAPTNAQTRVFFEIVNDLKQGRPMLRLVQGDVGSGKTLVALMAVLQTVKQGGQAVLMAPTELLAKQHFNNALKYLGPFGVKIALLTGSLKKPERREILEGIKTGAAEFVVGTHSLFQDDVVYKHLSLAIIDEQHRFGIKQRIALLSKAPPGTSPHQLVMTATPIPRTLQLALYSDLDVSSLDELPPGRTPIVTTLLKSDSLPQLMERLSVKCREGVQVYWICPFIESAEHEELSVLSRYESLKKALPGFEVGLLHGQLKDAQKEEVMANFAAGKIQILAATTIVEVGVDVPNAAVMIIEGAEHFGLAQLHQLRGRVGRGSTQSYCILVHDLTDYAGLSYERLNAMRRTNDGFEIARQDLILRGPGDVLGYNQAGFNLFKIADVSRDLALIEEARAAAEQLLTHYDIQAEALVKRWFPHYA